MARQKMPRKVIVSSFSVVIAAAMGGSLLASGNSAEAAEPDANQASASQDRTSSSGSEINRIPEEARHEGDIEGQILHAQVLLDAAGFSPGVIDGMEGRNFNKALRGYQEAHDLEITGELDTPTRKSLLRDKRRSTRELMIDSSVVDGEFVDIPDDAAKQAELDRMSYTSLKEELAERFHTTEAVIDVLNPGKEVAVGRVLRLPNVLPTSRDYTGANISEYKNWFNAMNVNASGMKGDHILVDESEGVLRVLDADDNLVAQFPVTTGSEKDPLPIGDWKVTTFSFLPPFNYQPDLFWDVPDSESEQRLPPGPNGPVGVAWLDLTKEHYGLHGTSEPSTIGYAQSHGCLRLTNWDVLKVAYMMKPGFEAEFVE